LAITRPLTKAQSGFTLLELLVVLVIIGIATSVAVLALPKSTQGLEDDAVRLAVRLDAARARAVALQAPVRLVIDAQGYQFLGYTRGEWKALPAPLDEQRFALELEVAVVGAPWLGPEPVGEPFSVALKSPRDGSQRIVSSDGVSAFALKTE
jgi:general secretion pathway protein H